MACHRCLPLYACCRTDWHDKVAQGEEAAPFPEPKLIETAKPADALPEKTITDFGFMDDDDEGQIKLYIKLEGDLESLTKDDVDLKVESRWGNASMIASLKGQKFMHILGAEKLAHDVIPEECKVKVLTKKQKCVIVLQKRGDPKMPWEGANRPMGPPARHMCPELRPRTHTHPCTDLAKAVAVTGRSHHVRRLRAGLVSLFFPFARFLVRVVSILADLRQKVALPYRRGGGG